MVDFHNSGKANQVGDLAFRDVNSFINNWEKLVKDLNANPNVSGKLLIDLINEPDAYNIRWEAANGNPGLTDMYLRALDRLYPACPDCLFVIEGTGQVGTGPANNWGDGYATSVGAGTPAAGAAAFFTAALAAPYAANLVLGPHLYPPSISMRAAGAGDGRGDSPGGAMARSGGRAAAGGPTAFTGRRGLLAGKVAEALPPGGP